MHRKLNGRGLCQGFFPGCVISITRTKGTAPDKSGKKRMDIRFPLIQYSPEIV